MKSKKNIKNNSPEKIIDKAIAKGKEVVNTAKQGAEVVTEITTGMQNTLDSASNLTQSIKGVKDSFLESKKIQANTKIELEKIQKNHQQVNTIIAQEYGKQKQTMDKASDVVDSGLESNDLDIIREGLNAMTNVANHNPVEKLKRNMDEELKKNLNKELDDDDFVIEI